MCVGDSTTYGSSLTCLSDRWSDITAERTDFVIDNLGVSGDTTYGMLASCQSQVFPRKPDALIIMGRVCQFLPLAFLAIHERRK